MSQLFDSLYTVWTQNFRTRARYHPTQRRQRTQRNRRNDCSYPCVLAVASAVFAAYFLA